MKYNALPDLEELNRLFSLDDGRLYWNVKPSRWQKIGSIAGTTLNTGYRQVTVSGKRYLEHRIIYKMETGVDPEDFRLDHINGVVLDNRIENLRLATQQQNVSHRVNLNKNNTSGERGVIWWKTRKKWRAQIMKNGKLYAFGAYDNIEDAKEAVRAARAQAFGEFN